MEAGGWVVLVLDLVVSSNAPLVVDEGEAEVVSEEVEWAEPFGGWDVDGLCEADLVGDEVAESGGIAAEEPPGVGVLDVGGGGELFEDVRGVVAGVDGDGDEVEVRV